MVEMIFIATKGI